MCRGTPQSALANAPSGLSIGHVLQRDGSRAEQELKKLFSKKKIWQSAVIAQEKPKVPQRNLKVCPIKVHGADVFCLWDTGAVPNLIATKLADKVGLTPEKIKKITVAHGTIAINRGLVRSVPIAIGELKTKMDFFCGGQGTNRSTHWHSRDGKTER